MRRALLLIDIQNDFLPPHGALAVPQGDAILPCVYRLLEEGEWAVVLASQGIDVDLDAYSAFAVPLAEQDTESDPAHSTLARLLNDAEVEQIVVVGLALDFCVRQSVSDAVKVREALGKQWDIVVVREGVKSVDPDQKQLVTEDLQAQGVRFLGVQDLLPP
ncbi:hypothetical protein B0A53_04427 [Rhodotorula sp. CCFEE 5036]|nr:hypothetical protein B0A53_04427 [Rhodotorula sp. CCFEE 5036]